MTGENVGALTVFRTTVEVMLRDGVLTWEKRLIIKLANALGLSPESPQRYILQSVKAGNLTEEKSRPMNRDWSTQEF